MDVGETQYRDGAEHAAVIRAQYLSGVLANI